MTDRPPSDGAEPLNRDDLRQVATRLDARLQEAKSRLVLHDGRFAAMSDRFRQTERRAEAFAARIDTRFVAIDQRLNAIDVRLDIADGRRGAIADELADHLRTYQAALRRTTILGLAATLMANGLMIGVLWLVT